MDDINKWNWLEETNEFVWELSLGKAIIKEIINRNTGKYFLYGTSKFEYHARFEKHNGKVIKSEFVFLDFDRARIWIQYEVVPGLENRVKGGYSLDAMLEAIAKCLVYVPENVKKVNQGRLEIIQELLKGNQVSVTGGINLKYSIGNINWKEENQR